jgi:hypothetical protein
VFQTARIGVTWRTEVMTLSNAQDAAGRPGWQEQYAYTLGVQVYVFGFPYVYLPSLRWNWVTVPRPPGSITPMRR